MWKQSESLYFMMKELLWAWASRINMDGPDGLLEADSWNEKEANHKSLPIVAGDAL